LRVEQGKGRICAVEHLRPHVSAGFMLRRFLDPRRRLAFAIIDVT